MSKCSAILASLAMSTVLIGCSANYGPKETGGTLVGAGLGALAGSQIGSGTGQLVAVGLGTLAGALLGNEVGRLLDRADRLHAGQTAQTGLESVPSGHTVGWRNPDSGHSGTFTPTSTYESPSGQYCREFQQTVSLGGRMERAYGTACRRPDGSWEITS